MDLLRKSLSRLRYRHIIALILVALVIVGGAFYLLSQEQPAPLSEDEALAPDVKEPTISTQTEGGEGEPTVPTQTEGGEQTFSSPSEEELTALWANGERCPQKGFSTAPSSEDIVEVDKIQFYINLIDVNFVDEVTCTDVERIAQLINAKIIGFEPVTKFYEFKIETRTIAELEEAIAKIKALNDPTITSVFRVTYLAPESFLE